MTAKQIKEAEALDAIQRGVAESVAYNASKRPSITRVSIRGRMGRAA